jgi:hypothetical protein
MSCDPTWVCRPSSRSRSLARIRAIASRAAGADRPNFDPSCPVACAACVDAWIPGITRTRQLCTRPAGTAATSRSTSSRLSTTTVPTPHRTASSISSVVLALPCSTSVAGSAPAASAVTISPPPATSSHRPSDTMSRCTAVQANAFDAKATCERGHRSANPSR